MKGDARNEGRPAHEKDGLAPMEGICRENGIASNEGTDWNLVEADEATPARSDAEATPGNISTAKNRSTRVRKRRQFGIGEEIGADTRNPRSPAVSENDGHESAGMVDRSVGGFTFGKAPVKAINEVLAGQQGWVRYFQLGEFLALPWQKDCPMEARVEFITNYNEKTLTTVVQGNVIDLSVISLAGIFRLNHGNIRIQKDSAFVSTNIAANGECAAGYMVAFAKKHWVSRYEAILPMLLLKNPKRAISRGLTEWLEVKTGVKDTAHTFFWHLHKELRRLQRSSAKDTRSLKTPIGPHLALLIFGTDGHLQRNDRDSGLQEAREEMKLAVAHLLTAQRAMTNVWDEPVAMLERVRNLEADLSKRENEVAALKKKCEGLTRANIELLACSSA